MNNRTYGCKENIIHLSDNSTISRYLNTYAINAYSPLPFSSQSNLITLRRSDNSNLPFHTSSSNNIHIYSYSQRNTFLEPKIPPLKLHNQQSPGHPLPAMSEYNPYYIPHSLHARLEYPWIAKARRSP